MYDHVHQKQASAVTMLSGIMMGTTSRSSMMFALGGTLGSFDSRA